MDTTKGVSFWVATLVCCFVLAAGAKEKALIQHEASAVDKSAKQATLLSHSKPLAPQGPLFAITSPVTVSLNQQFNHEIYKSSQ